MFQAGMLQRYPTKATQQQVKRIYSELMVLYTQQCPVEKRNKEFDFLKSKLKTNKLKLFLLYLNSHFKVQKETSPN